jgi:hypothetical protein
MLALDHNCLQPSPAAAGSSSSCWLLLAAAVASWQVIPLAGFRLSRVGVGALLKGRHVVLHLH